MIFLYFAVTHSCHIASEKKKKKLSKNERKHFTKVLTLGLTNFGSGFTSAESLSVVNFKQLKSYQLMQSNASECQQSQTSLCQHIHKPR